MKLVESARASGREVHVITYRDGVTAVKCTLIFHDPEHARECARLLNEATYPRSPF